MIYHRPTLCLKTENKVAVYRVSCNVYHRNLNCKCYVNIISRLTTVLLKAFPSTVKSIALGRACQNVNVIPQSFGRFFYPNSLFTAMVRRFEEDQNYFADNSTLADAASQNSRPAETKCKYSYFCWSVNEFVIYS